MKVLVTGVAGFIGFHLSKTLLSRGDELVGVDNLNDYYSVQLKKDRLAQLEGQPGFTFIKLDIADKQAVEQLFEDHQFDCVVNLAAQAGVRYSLENPGAYVDANIVGFTNILEGCRHHQVQNFVYASSSSVYGANAKYPFSEHDNVDHPMSLYAATKKANELMAHTYSSLYGLPTTGLRFFTVYGPWGRPDMALFMFAKNIIEGKPIDVYNNGEMWRDFTYVDDIVAGIVGVIDHPAKSNPTWSAESPDSATSYAPFAIYNIGNGESVRLMDFISALEDVLGKKAEKNFLPMQQGDVAKTYADTRMLQEAVSYSSATNYREGVKHFVEWYVDYFGVSL